MSSSSQTFNPSLILSAHHCLLRQLTPLHTCHLHLTNTCQLPKSISCVPFFNPFPLDYRVTIVTIPLSIHLIPFTTPANIHLYIHWCGECCHHRPMVSNPSCNSALHLSVCLRRALVLLPFSTNLMPHFQQKTLLVCPTSQEKIQSTLMLTMFFHIGLFGLYNNWDR